MATRGSDKSVGKQAGTPARKKKSAKKTKSKPIHLPVTFDEAVDAMLKTPKKKDGK